MDSSAGDYSTAGAAPMPGPSDAFLAARIEAVLFVLARPVPVNQLASALEVSPREIEAALSAWQAERSTGGLRLQRQRGMVQLTTAPEFARDIERVLSLAGPSRLTKAALEVLAIVAYEQPVTRPRIESIRGVNSESVLHTLLRYGLVEEMGRSEGPGRPVLYSTTPEFLQQFGLGSVQDLPPFSSPPGPDQETQGEDASAAADTGMAGT